jgi:hypothetical protein
MKTTWFNILVALLAGTNLVMAQDAQTSAPPMQQSPAQDDGWRRISPGPAAADAGPGPQNAPLQNTPPSYTLPSRLNLPQGAFVTVRVNQPLSSDHNQAGDAFSASLVQPVIVDGVIVAERGQTIGGHVVEAQKAGRVEGTSRLKIQLTDLTLVDGQVMPLQTSLISRNGPTSVGRDAGAIAGTTALGAAVGAAAGWGTGAAIGAGAGAVAGTIGVLLTRGHPTIIGPETVLTFRVETPVTISTDRSPQAFRFVEPGDYNHPANLQARPGPPPPVRPYYGYGYPYAPYYGPGYAYGPGYYWGPSVYFGFGGRYYRH